MALRVATASTGHAAWQAPKGTVLDDTHEEVALNPSNFLGLKSTVVDNSAGVYATPIALTESQSGSIILVNVAAGLDFTLPAVGTSQVGISYKFLVTTTITTNNFRVTAASGDFLNGAVWIADFDTANTGAYFTANGSSHLAMTCNGSTTGGKKGTVVIFTAISSTGWFVEAPQFFGDSTLATPFS